MQSPYILHPVSSEQHEQWDRFVSTHPAGHLLQSWGWGELKAHAGWSPARLALWDGQRIVAAAHVLRRGVPRLPLRAGHLAYIPGGPVIDWSDSTLCTAFFSQLTTSLRRQGAIAMRIEPMQEVHDILSKETFLGHMRNVHPIQPLRTIILDLTPSEDTLLAQMKEKWRYNVRLAARKGVTVRVAANPDDVRAWYTLLQTTGVRDQFGVHTYDYYLRAWEIFAPTNQARLLLAEHNGQLLAGIFVSVFAQQGIYLYGASSNEQRQLMPNYLLQWEAIRWAKQQGAHSYDFWGIPDTDGADEAMAGVYRFKSGWGGRIVHFPGCYEAVYHPLAMQIARRFIEI